MSEPFAFDPDEALFWMGDSAAQVTETPRANNIKGVTASTKFSPATVVPLVRISRKKSRAGSKKDIATNTPTRPTRVYTPSTKEDDFDPSTEEEDKMDVEDGSTTEPESESSQDPSRQPSFAFSEPFSRESSTTSVSSADSFDSTTGRKRTLAYYTTSPAKRKFIPSAQRGETDEAPPSKTSRPHRTAESSFAPSQTGSNSQTLSPLVQRMSSVFPTANSQPSSSLSPDSICIIAHHPGAQTIFDSKDISWGVQYEVARGVSLKWWSWDQVLKAGWDNLTGPSLEAVPKLYEVMKISIPPAQKADPLLWAELDREEHAIREGQGRGLGLMGPWDGADNWYGGHIQQVARLELVEDQSPPSFHLNLQRMEMLKSNRFARFLGSRHLLQVSIPDAVLRKHSKLMDDFLLKKFILCGRVFQAFGCKDGKTFLMEINEDHQRLKHTPGDEQRMPLAKFVAWHNPMESNAKQPVTKWSTRFDLGLSVSVPVLRFDPENMFYMDDEYAPFEGSKAPTEAILTDGCGFINGAALALIGKAMNYPGRPTAVQGRIAGSKGLWTLHPDISEQSSAGIPKIWSRSSQVKIKFNHELHPAHTILDLLAPPRVTVPSRLSRLTILNLAHNGVPTDVFKTLMKAALEQEVATLTQWSGAHAMPLLWRAINRVGGVSTRRLLQYALGASRALGLTGRAQDDNMEEDLEDIIQELKVELAGQEDTSTMEDVTVNSLRTPFSGQPLTLHATAMDLLQANFHPAEEPLLYDKLKIILKFVIQDVIEDLHISIPLSAEAFIIPDPFHVLEENEIQFKSTEDLKSPYDPRPKILLGDVLIYRNPCRLPSDVQKVKAVEHPLLSEYVNVIVLSTKGSRSFANLLAGGDYDGDVAVCIYDPILVDPFTTPPLTLEPNRFIEDNFQDTKTIPQVQTVQEQMLSLGPSPAATLKLQKALLSGLTKAPVGQYSMYHENAAYVHGYASEEAVKLAFMFNTVLDSRKTGHRVRPDIMSQDRRKYDRKRPDSLVSRKKGRGGDEAQHTNNVATLRRVVSGPFILDELLSAGMQMQSTHLAQYDTLAPATARQKPDLELLQPYETAQAFARSFTAHHRVAVFEDILRALERHVDEHIGDWQSISSEQKKTKVPSTPSKAASKRAGSAGALSAKAAKARREKLYRSFNQPPKDLPPTSPMGDVDELRASIAYRKNPRFAWEVAFHALCTIKVKAGGRVAAMTQEFADLMSMSSSAQRVLEQSRVQ